MENVSSTKNTTKQSTSNCSESTLGNLLQINWFLWNQSMIRKAIESKFLTPQKFAMEIEKIVVEEFNYIDAICYYCEINNLEIESVTKLISKS